jgi:hypothetical protein
MIYSARKAHNTESHLIHAFNALILLNMFVNQLILKSNYCLIFALKWILSLNDIQNDSLIKSIEEREMKVTIEESFPTLYPSDILFKAFAALRIISIAKH